MTTTLPASRVRFTDAAGRPTPEFYRFLQTLKRVQDGSASDDDLAEVQNEIKGIAIALGSPTGDVEDIPPISSGYPTLKVTAPLRLSGLLQDGFAVLSWSGTTDSVPEGETNLYFTDERAQAAAVDNAITPGVTNKAPSEDAVAKALANVAAGVPYFIPDGENYTVPNNIQALWTLPIELEGDATITVNGELVGVA